MIGTVGVTSLIIEDDINFAIKNVGLFKTSRCKDYVYYILCYLRSKRTSDYINTRLAGTTQRYISLKELRGLPIIHPKISKLNAFNKDVSVLFDEITNRTEENKTLSSLRNTLLPNLLSGDVDIF